MFQEQIARILGNRDQAASGKIIPAEVFQAAKSGDLTKYQHDLMGYAERECGFTPWETAENKDSQASMYQAIQESVDAQLAGHRAVHEFSIKSAHGTGKTISAAVLVNWFFDAFPDCIIITTAPSFSQVVDLLWKDIRKTRPAWGKKHLLPAEPRMAKSPTHFALGRTTSDAGGQGTARFHGQHAKYMLFVFDEADGVPGFAYGSVDGMMTSIAPGQVILFLRIGNPQSRNSEFHRRHGAAGVQAMQFDALDYPNVVTGENLIPGGTSREWVSGMIAKHCEKAAQHDETAFTFELDWDTAGIAEDGTPVPVQDKNGALITAGTPIRPNSEFLWRVRGITPPNAIADTVISEGRYLAALSREVEPNLDDVRKIFLGVDCARYGTDAGTVYRRQSLKIRHEATIQGMDSHAYVGEIAKSIDQGIREAAEYDLEGLPIEISIRIDGTGGYGAGIIDLLKLVEMPEGVELKLHEISFGGAAHDPASYYDIVTEMYSSTDETLAYHRLETDIPELKLDLTDRKIGYRPGRDKRLVRKLEPKDDFKKRNKRSPDHGDGCALCAAEERLIVKRKKAGFFMGAL